MMPAIKKKETEKQEAKPFLQGSDYGNELTQQTCATGDRSLKQ